MACLAGLVVERRGRLHFRDGNDVDVQVQIELIKFYIF
jgi:hypothetical protein